MKKRILVNTCSSLIYQIVYIVYGFILPRLILANYGSEVNGLISSINQYLSVISLTEFGMTTVIQASLYKHLVKEDYVEINKILTSASKFFRRISIIFVFYIMILCIIYPMFAKSIFSNSYVIVLIIILSLNMLVEYAFGITDKQLLIAEQKIYFCQIVSSIAFVLNTIFCFILVNQNISIHALKIVTAIIMLINSMSPIIYVKIHYPQVNCHTQYDSEPIKQKWNGLAQHLSTYIYTSTDVIVLTFLSTLKNVSIYAVYNMILNGLKQLTSIFDNAVRPVFGRLWVQNDEKLYDYFNLFEIAINMISVFVFGCASCLITSFVKIYTHGVNDIEYSAPLFALLFTLAFLLQNIKNPYHMLIQSVGKFKETQRGYIATAIINIVISVAFVIKFGLAGIAVGTLVAAGYQFLYLFYYIHKYIFDRKYRISMKIYIVDIIIFVFAFLIIKILPNNINTIIDWILYAMKIAAIWGTISVIVGGLVYRNSIWDIYYFIIKKKKHKNNKHGGLIL